VASRLILTFLFLLLSCEAFEWILVSVATAFGVSDTNVKNAFTAVLPESSDPLISLEISLYYWGSCGFGCASVGSGGGGDIGVVATSASSSAEDWRNRRCSDASISSPTRIALVYHWFVRAGGGLESHPSQIDPLVGSSAILLIDEAAMLAIEAVLSGELGTAVIIEPWQIGWFESISISDVVGEFLGAEDGAIPVCWHSR
jgi:hypothetical protein